jgi:hypothetical protein
MMIDDDDDDDNDQLINMAIDGWMKIFKRFPTKPNNNNNNNNNNSQGHVEAVPSFSHKK